MNALEDLRNEMRVWFSPEEIDELVGAVLREHAHKLAETIRNSPGWFGDGEWMDSRDRDHAANLIEPPEVAP